MTTTQLVPAPGTVVRNWNSISRRSRPTDAERLAWLDSVIAADEDGISALLAQAMIQRDLLIATVSAGFGDGSLISVVSG